MIPVSADALVWLVTGHTDMRKGLCELVIDRAGDAAPQSKWRAFVRFSWTPRRIPPAAAA